MPKGLGRRYFFLRFRLSRRISVSPRPRVFSLATRCLPALSGVEALKVTLRLTLIPDPRPRIDVLLLNGKWVPAATRPLSAPPGGHNGRVVLHFRSCDNQ